MRAFNAEADGTYSAELEPDEASMFAELASQLTVLLEGRSASVIPDADEDPALRRLLPDAYPDDAEASSEFRRFTADGLAERKVANARVVIESLADVAAGTAQQVRLDPSTAQAWLRTLTDLRLTVAARLGIEGDTDDDPDDHSPLRELYDWLGFVQGTLVEVLDPT